MQKMSFKMSEDAQKDIESIAEYLWQESLSHEVVFNFSKVFYDKVDLICKFPEIGSKKDEYLVGSRASLIFRNYKIFYVPDFNKKIIFILRVLHGARDIDIEYFEKFN